MQDFAYIIARKFANRAANLGAIAPSGARFVGTLFDYTKLTYAVTGLISRQRGYFLQP